MDWKKWIPLFLIFCIAPYSLAQAPPFSTGFRAPMEVAFTRGGNLLVAEAGNGPNSGRLSLVDRTSGTRRTLVDALPSGIHAGAQPSPSGPAGMAIQGNAIYLAIGNGDSVEPGPLPRTEIPTENPSSPLFSSVLELKSSRPLDAIQGGFLLDMSHQELLAAGQSVELSNGAGESLSIRLVVNFPDFTAEPRPDFPQNVRLSNPFGVEIIGQTLFVVDASQNLVYKVNVQSGFYSTLTTFSGFPNPIPGLGGPFVEVVPTAVRVRGNDLLVTTLTGFPFPVGSAEVRRLSMDGAVNTTYAGGLTSAIDLVLLGASPDASIAVLEFSTNFLAGAPGRLSLLSLPSSRVTLAEGLITPTSLAVDQHTGEIFVSHLGPGIVTRIDASGSIPKAFAPASIPVVGSVEGAFGSRFTTSLQIANPFSFAISGRLVFRPAGTSAETAAVPYALAPFESRQYSDFGGAIGIGGIGVVDIETAPGQVPETIARITSEGSGGIVSIHVPRAQSSDILPTGARGVLIAPADPLHTRLNIGVRTFGASATIEVTRFESSGMPIASVTWDVPAETFAQVPASELLGSGPAGGEVISFEIRAGSALIYGAATENDGSGIVLKVAGPVPEN